MAEETANAFRWSLACALLALLFVIISIATPEWTVLENKTIGLWVLSDGDNDYVWSNQWAYYEDFFYSDFMQACRGLMMAGVMIGGLGCLYHMFILSRKQYTASTGTVLLGYYLLASFLMLTTACVYSAMIPQPVCPDGGQVCANEDALSFDYTGNYGYSLWFCWIGGGMFLLPGAMTYEGGRHETREKKRDVVPMVMQNSGAAM